MTIMNEVNTAKNIFFNQANFKYENLDTENNARSYFIQTLYDSVNRGFIESQFSVLYKGIIMKGNKWKEIYNKFNEHQTDNNIPKAILYGASFFSFYKEESSFKNFKNNNFSRFNDVMIYLYLGRTQYPGIL